MKAPLPGRAAPARFGRALGIALAIVAMLAAGCAKPSSRSAQTPRSVLEFAEVVSAGTPGAIELASYDASRPSVHVVDIVRYEVVSTSVQPGSLGTPSVWFELSKDDGAKFSSWTAARLRRSMAAILDRKVVVVATIRDELPGNGVLEFGELEITREEVKRIAESLTAPR